MTAQSSITYEPSINRTRKTTHYLSEAHFNCVFCYGEIKPNGGRRGEWWKRRCILQQFHLDLSNKRLSNNPLPKILQDFLVFVLLALRLTHRNSDWTMTTNHYRVSSYAGRFSVKSFFYHFLSHKFYNYSVKIIFSNEGLKVNRAPDTFTK